MDRQLHSQNYKLSRTFWEYWNEVILEPFPLSAKVSEGCVKGSINEKVK